MENTPRFRSLSLGNGRRKHWRLNSRIHFPAKPTTRANKLLNAQRAGKWAERFNAGDSILKIAAREGVDPGTVSKWLHKLGVHVYSGRHFVRQPELKYGQKLVDLAVQGPGAISDFVEQRIWGASNSNFGEIQLARFCEFVRMHQQGKGVEEIARALETHRSTVSAWRESRDEPTYVRLAKAIQSHAIQPGWRLLPLHLTSGAEEQTGWITVTEKVSTHDGIARVVEQLPILSNAFVIAEEFGINENQLLTMQDELFAYLLGMIVGDSSKSGGKQERFASMSLDLQLSLKQPSNERVGKFFCLCLNCVGLQISRIADKQPTGSTRYGKQPSAAYRWTSERSPLLAWMFAAVLGLNLNERTELQSTENELDLFRTSKV